MNMKSKKQPTITDWCENQLEELKSTIDEQSEKINRLSFELSERKKENACQLEISGILNSEELAPGEVYAALVNTIIKGFQIPEYFSCTITLPGQIFYSDNFRESEIKLDSPLMMGGKPVGSLDVFCSDEGVQHLNVPFLPEEKALLDLLALWISNYYQHNVSNEQIAFREGRYRNFFDSIGEVLLELDTKRLSQN